jgi:predicted dehydrogenase
MAGLLPCCPSDEATGNRVKRLRVGVIGAGSWTVMSHLPNLERRRSELDFVGVNRLGREQLERIGARFGFGLVSEDYRDVLEAGCDVVIVGSPPNLHYEHTKAALESGAHVMCEKPFTLEPAHAWELCSIAERLDRHIIIAFGFNYLPMVERARELLVGTGIGEIEHLVVHMASVTRELLSASGPYPEASPDVEPDMATWTAPEVAGGGYAQAQLSHALGLALWLTGLRGSGVFSLMASPMDAPVELHDAIAVRYSNGAIGTVSGASSHVGVNANREQLEVRAVGSRGQLLLDIEREAIWLFRDGAEVRVPLEPGAGRYECDGPVNGLIDLAQGTGRNNSPPDLAARTVEILDAAYRSARSGAFEVVCERD